MSRIIIVNDQDEVIGAKERDEISSVDLYRVSALWIKNSHGDILLAQRKLTKKHDPGKWGPAVAGTVEEGETYESNIVKEAEEEIGLKDIQPIKSFKYRATGRWNFFTQWFTLIIDKPAADFIIQEDEVERVRWFATEELNRSLKAYPEDFLEGLGWAISHL